MRALRDAREIELINRHADELNADAEDWLDCRIFVGSDKRRDRARKKKISRNR
jgi:hypothetical protein